jgi:hypothetical protein
MGPKPFLLLACLTDTYRLEKLQEIMEKSQEGLWVGKSSIVPLTIRDNGLGWVILQDQVRSFQ